MSDAAPVSTFTKVIQICDLFLKGVGLTVVAVGGWVGWQQYLAAEKAERVVREREIDQRQRQYSSTYYAAQLQTYLEYTDCAMRIATKGTIQLDNADDPRAPCLRGQG